MPRATNVPATRRRRKRVLKQARGYWGNKSRLYRFARDAVHRSGQYAYRDRRKKKTVWRQLWIVRINSACRAHEISYSRFMNGLKVAGIELNRKALSELAIHEPEAFGVLVGKAQAALN
jgi:large subunit ribosomal protein L20